MTLSRSIFGEDWWFDALAPNRWGSVEIADGGRVVARWAYLIESGWGLKRLSSPYLTPPIGPWIAAAFGTAERDEAFAALISRLPRYDLLSIHLPPESMD